MGVLGRFLSGSDSLIRFLGRVYAYVLDLDLGFERSLVVTFGPWRRFQGRDRGFLMFFPPILFDFGLECPRPHHSVGSHAALAPIDGAWGLPAIG